MNHKNNLSNYFDNILSSIKTVEQDTQIFSRLHSISKEVTQLEKYVKSSFATLDNHFQAYIEQVNLLSNLIEFQREVVQFESAEEMIRSIFSYFQENIQFDHAFLYLKDKPETYQSNLLVPDTNNLPLYESFIKEGQNLENLFKMVSEKDLGVLLSNVNQYNGDQPSWGILKAVSVIIFPLKVKKELIGFGVISCKKENLILNHLSFVNLGLGLLSILLYLHFYFFDLRKKAAKHLRFQTVLEDVKYADYFDKGPLLIFSLDLRGTILHANASAVKARIKNKEDIIGEKFFNLLFEEHRTPFEEMLDRMHVGDLRYYKCPVLADNNQRRVWEFHVTKMELNNNFVMNVLFVIDTTHAYYQEQKLARDEIINQITQFSQVMNGYLNNLLTVMIPNVSLLTAELPVDHNSQKYLRRMDEALKQTGKVVKKFLNYNLSEIEKPQMINLNKLIVAIINRLKKKFPETVELKYSLDPGIPKTLIYPKRLTQLIKILVQNSVEAITNKGILRISTKIVNMKQDNIITPQMFYLPKGKYVELAIQDNGAGIDPELIPHIFKPFFSTKIKNEGMGLGLFRAYNIVKDLKSEIYVTSKPEKLTTFYVYLSQKEAPRQPMTLPIKAEPQKEKQRPYILVVDDEYSIRNVLKDILELNGYKVFTASNGKEGLAVFQEYGKNIDLVVLDMVMPEMDGRTAFHEIRKLKADQKVIVISGYAKRGDLQEVFSQGALAFMSKPFQINDIVDKVAEVLKT